MNMISVTSKEEQALPQQMPKSGKRKDSKESHRVNSGFIKTDVACSLTVSPAVAGSVVGSVASVDSKGKPRSFPLWPEFTENDINAEKWEGGAKGKEKGKSPSLQFFDDPEGKLELPPSLKVDHWKRPQDFITTKIPVVVDNENVLDIMRPNEHLCHSQLMRTIISQMIALWETTRTKSRSDSGDNPWIPWDHIYSLCKAGKGHTPLYNQYGKYIVRLFWMGSWRKIVVDDLMPYDLDDRLLLPSSSVDHELWPLLLSKALIKISCLDYNMVSDVPEIGDYFVIQCLTGWIPETIPLQFSHNNNVWELVKKILPEWKLPEEKGPVDAENKPREMSVGSVKPPENIKPEHVGSPTSKPDKGSGKDGKTSKEGTRKKDEKEKSKSRPHSDARPTSARSGTDKSVIEEPVSTKPENVQMVVFGTFSQQHPSPAPMSVLRDMANSSEKLRKVGLSHLHTHPVLVSKTRSCSLVPPTPVPEIPRWKLIRPHKKKLTPHDEPQPEPEVPKPDQWLELESPYIGFRPTPAQNVDSAASVIHSRTGSVSFSEVDEEREANGDPSKSKTTSKVSKRSSDPSQSRKASGRDSVSIVSPATLVKDVDVASEAESMSKQDIEEEHHEDEDGPDAIPPVDEVIRKTWIDFDDFCKSFTNIVIFHKPNSYPYNESSGEMKQAAMNAGVASGAGSKKGSASMNQTVSNTNVVKPSTSPVTPKSYEGYPLEERTPSFLFVDSLKQTELIVNYSVLPRWLGLEEKLKSISDKESVAGASEVVSVKHEGTPVIPSGLLVAEPYSWKSLVTGQPILRIRTTGTRAACLTLPPGRHVLRFIFNSPLGYHVHVCSTTKFVFGDEDTVMAPLQEESCRFVEAANKIMGCVDKCLDVFGSDVEWKNAAGELRKAHMPYQPENTVTERNHYDDPKELTYERCKPKDNGPPNKSLINAWRKAFYSTMNTALGESKVSSLEFALRSFLLDFEQHSFLGHHQHAGSKDLPENWQERIASDEESGAATKIQKSWRGTYTRKLIRANKAPESREHTTAQEALKALRAALQQNFQGYALSLLRSMLKANPSLMMRFPFYKDEWSRICYTDYHGTFVEQPAKTWFVVFREIFHVEEDTLCVPKIYVPIATCMLRVINNDNGEEVKRVFQKVAPNVYKKNKRGYTFVAEARTLENPLSAGKWRMRLIGSMNSLPLPITSQFPSAFSTKEIKDYYVPNKYHTIMRYTIKPQINLVASIQLETSKQDVHIHLQIFDNDIEVASTRGLGFCVIPAYYFLSNNRERSSSRTSNPDTKPAVAPPVQPSKLAAGKKQTGSAKKHDGKTSPKERKPDSGDSITVASVEEVIDNSYPHNYILQATVERKSWPLTKGQWAYVQKLKEIEKEELKAFSEPKIKSPRSADREVVVKSPRMHSRVAGHAKASNLSLKRSPNHKSMSQLHPHSGLVNKERLGSAGGQRQSGGGKGGADKSKKAGKAGGAEKTTKEKRQADKETGSRPSSQHIFDDSRAYWTARVVVDLELGEEIEIKKDTQRQEEIRAMKQAWETAEPGRAIKAMQSRLLYLGNNALKTESSDKENEDEDEKSGELVDHASPEPADDKELLESPPVLPPSQKDMLKPVDFTSYIRPLHSDVKPRYISAEALSVLEEEDQRVKVEEHNVKRAKSLAYRDQNRIDRMILKEQQLEKCQEMQYALDKARTELLKPRQEYRQNKLDDQKMKDEAAEAAMAATLAASEPSSPDGKGRKSAGKKKK